MMRCSKTCLVGLAFWTTLIHTTGYVIDELNSSTGLGAGATLIPLPEAFAAESTVYHADKVSNNSAIPTPVEYAPIDPSPIVFACQCTGIGLYTAISQGIYVAANPSALDPPGLNSLNSPSIYQDYTNDLVRPGLWIVVNDTYTSELWEDDDQQDLGTALYAINADVDESYTSWRAYVRTVERYQHSLSRILC